MMLDRDLYKIFCLYSKWTSVERQEELQYYLVKLGVRVFHHIHSTYVLCMIIVSHLVGKGGNIQHTYLILINGGI